MRHIPARLRQLVIQHSGYSCEYCHLAQAGQEATFHIDHVTPVALGGKTVVDNLALACVSCSLRKAARQTAIDPQTATEVCFVQSAARCLVRALSMARRAADRAYCNRTGHN